MSKGLDPQITVTNAYPLQTQTERLKIIKEWRPEKGMLSYGEIESRLEAADKELALHKSGARMKELEGKNRDLRKRVAELEADIKPFPMQDGPDITWATARKVYELYSELYGNGQSLERIAERCGFGWKEVAGMQHKILFPHRRASQ